MIQSFRLLTPQEKANIKPLRIRVVTVKPGDTLTSLSNQIMGTERKLDLFRLINALPPGGTVSVGDKVKSSANKKARQMPGLFYVIG